MTCLITGANGMLGAALLNVLKGTDWRVIPSDQAPGNSGMRELDITDKAAVDGVMAEHKPELVFHLAARTDVDKCEGDPDGTYLVNTLGTENVALACREYDATMVYLSTLSIFDGKKSAPYTEFDHPNPLSVYAKSKLEGEKIVSGILQRYFIFRCGWLLGGGMRDKKFVAKIIELLKTKKEIPVVSDKFGNPTFTKDFSQAMLKVVDTKRYGLYHLTNQGYASRYEIACKIRDLLGKKDVVIKAVSSNDFPLPAPRPDWEVGENFKLKLMGMADLTRPWQEALRDYLKSDYGGAA